MRGWNPWRELADDHEDIEVFFVDVDVPGLYFPDQRAIVIATGQTVATRRSALAEELAHHVLKHRPTDDETGSNRQEIRARRWAAHRLVTIDELAEALVAASCWTEVCEYLNIDRLLLTQRVNDLTRGESKKLRRAVGKRELHL